MKTRGAVQVGPNRWEQIASFKSDRQQQRWVNSMMAVGWTVKSQSTGGAGVGRLKDFTVVMQFVSPDPAVQSEADFRKWATEQIMKLAGDVARLESELAAVLGAYKPAFSAAAMGAPVVNISALPVASDPWGVTRG